MNVDETVPLLVMLAHWPKVLARGYPCPRSQSILSWLDHPRLCSMRGWGCHLVLGPGMVLSLKETYRQI